MSLDRREWLEADGLGGFASGTVSGARTRRYHALLLAAARPPADRVVLVNGFEAHVESAQGTFPISTQRYGDDVVHPDGASRIASFDREPWPRWTFRLEDGTVVEQEILAIHGAPAVVLRWRRIEGGASRLVVRPLMSGRDFHSLQRENGSFAFVAESRDGVERIRAYDGVPAVRFGGNGSFEPAPDWYRNFVYDEERRRGLDHVEDLASPGRFVFDLEAGDAWLVLTAETPGVDRIAEMSAPALYARETARRARFSDPLDRAAEAYLAERGEGATIVAGFPWFGDWGRDTFIAMRGLCLAGGRLDDAGSILREWAGAVSEGMLPNRFPDRGQTPEFNSVDASLWYVVAAGEYLELRPEDAGGAAIRAACEAILDGYARGTRYGIRMDRDGLVACGEPGVQLTWMDAKVGDWVVTPRIGKPVEIQALWIRALRAASAWAPRFASIEARALASFRERFPNPENGYLYDVIDVDHVPGRCDGTIRPNAIFGAVLLDDESAARLLSIFESHLWTPSGPRSLAPREAGYRPVYEGGVVERDGAYHQGTVWPWLAGPFVEAWVAARGGTDAAKREAWERFVAPLRLGLETAGLGHLPEIADAEPPHAAKGCPFQAWSLGELLRLERVVLAPAAATVATR